ncbi:MAG TPA: LysM peptidoglycan-binding domain-containing protein, partial [Anaerolineales bacterium]|nr:LysM peptidoglycan-binding domain-containing protein [Anaerolineales bacterium]
GLPQSSNSAAGNETTSPSPEERISVAALSTPNSDGDIIHEVQPGQSLWQLAIAYDVKIDDIKRLNNLFDDNIYPGNKLLIKTDAILPTASLISVPTLEPSGTSTSAAVSISTLLPTVTIIFSTATTSPVFANSNSIMGVAMGIIALALLGGTVFTWLGSKRKTEN